MQAVSVGGPEKKADCSAHCFALYALLGRVAARAARILEAREPAICRAYLCPIRYARVTFFSQRQVYEHLSRGYRYWRDVYGCSVCRRAERGRAGYKSAKYARGAARGFYWCAGAA